MKRTVVIIILLLTLLVCLAALLTGFWVYSDGKGNPLGFLQAPPQIRIIKPQNGQVIESGQELIVASVAVADAGLSRVDFLVDGVIVQQHISSSVSEFSSSPIFAWAGTQPGWHRLAVIAVDQLGRSSPVSEIQAGVIIRTAGGLDVNTPASPDGVSQPAAGAADPGQQGVPQPDPATGIGNDGNAVTDQGNLPLAGNGAVVPGGAGEGQAVDGQAGDGGAGNRPVQPGNDPGVEVDPLPELPPAPDAQPMITEFNITTNINGQAGVTATVTGGASDDIGLEKLSLSWQSLNGGNDRWEMLCGVALACSFQPDIDLTTGDWVFSLQAYDSSGQASVPAIRLVQVIADAGQPPAAANHEFDPDLFSDWMSDHWQNVDFDLGVNLAGFDFGNILPDWRPLLPDPGAAPEQQDNMAVSRCITVTVAPVEAGNQVTLTVNCDFQAQEAGEFLMANVGKTVANNGSSGISLRVRDWYDPARRQIHAGEVFSWLDSDVTCGTSYLYDFSISRAIESGNNWGVRETLDFLKVSAKSFDCPVNSIANINFRSEPAAGGLKLMWQIAGGNGWPADLPPQGARFTLVRFDVASGQTDLLLNQDISQVQLQAGGNYQVVDDTLICGNHYFYTLAALPANADPGLVSPGWLLRSQISPPPTMCSDGTLGSIPLEVVAAWTNETFASVHLHAELPAGFAWPAGDEVVLKVKRIFQEQPACDAPPCAAGWATIIDVRITDAVRRDGLIISENVSSMVPGGNVIAYKLSLYNDNQEVQSGQNTVVRMPDAPPPSPKIQQLELSNNCPGGAPRCVKINWELFQQPLPYSHYSQAASLAVERKVGALDTQIFRVGLSDTSFVDTNPFMQDMLLANGQHRLICRYSVMYSMVAFDAGAHVYGASTIEVDTPACDQPWQQTIQAR